MKSIRHALTDLMAARQPILPPTFESWWSALSPAFRLLLACLRLTPDAAEIRQIASLSRAGRHWPELLSLVDRHRTAPLVYQNLVRYGEAVPAAALDALRSRMERNTLKSLANAAELVRLHHLLEGNHIPSLSLKGSALALQVYGSLARRHAGDIDLLVAPAQVELADQLLRCRYRRLVPAATLTPAQLRRFTRVMHHFEYVHRQADFGLELHWRPLCSQSPTILAFEQVWSRAAAVPLAGTSVKTLSLEDNLLYLAGHGAHHNWSRLFWLVDLAEIIRQHHTLNWPQLLAQAAAHGLLPQLLLGAVLAHKLLAAPLPPPLAASAWRNPLLPYQARVACRYLLCPDLETRPLSLRLHLLASRIQLAASLSQKMEITQEFLVGKDWMTRGLPDSLFFLYVLTRLPLWLQQQRRLRQQP